MNNKPKVSIIVPVYNAERTIVDTLQAIFEQDYPSIELCMVNDCSKDSSASLIEAFVAEHKRDGFEYMVLTHPANKGVAGARNTALDNVTGDYVYYVDADDRLDRNAISSMVKCAIETDSEIVGCNWYLDSGSSERYMRQAYFDSPEKAIFNLTRGVMRWNLWLFLVKRALYEVNHIRFVEHDDLGEDMMATLKLFSFCRSAVLLEEGLYHYKQTPSSISASYSDEKLRQVCANVDNVSSFVSSTVGCRILEKDIHFLKLNIKLPLLMTGRKEDYCRWRHLYKTSDKFIFQNEVLPLRTKLVEACAMIGLWPIVYCYQLLVSKLYYAKKS